MGDSVQPGGMEIYPPLEPEVFDLRLDYGSISNGETITHSQDPLYWFYGDDTLNERRVKLDETE